MTVDAPFRSIPPIKSSAGKSPRFHISPLYLFETNATNTIRPFKLAEHSTLQEQYPQMETELPLLRYARAMVRNNNLPMLNTDQSYQHWILRAFNQILFPIHKHSQSR